MGVRAVVMFNLDRSDEWKNDPELGRKIARDISYKALDQGTMPGVKVVEVSHADIVTLAKLDMYSEFNKLSMHSFDNNKTDHEATIRLLADAARELGYDLVKATC